MAAATATTGGSRSGGFFFRFPRLLSSEVAGFCRVQYGFSRTGALSSAGVRVFLIAEVQILRFPFQVVGCGTLF